MGAVSMGKTCEVYHILTHYGAVRLANAPLHGLKHLMFGCGGTFRTPSLWSCDGPAKDCAWGSKIFFLE